MTSTEILEGLENGKRLYGNAAIPFAPQTLLLAAASSSWPDAASLVRLHESALFFRAYPPNPPTAAAAEQVLACFPGWVQKLPAAEMEALADPEISGIAGTSLTAVFTYDTARSLAQRHPRSVDIEWDAYDDVDRLGPVLARLLPVIREEWPVEAHVPFRDYIRSVRKSSQTDLQWLLSRVQDGREYNTLGLPLTWTFGKAVSRSGLHLRTGKLFCHPGPLLRRSDVSLTAELEGEMLPVRRLPRSEGRRMLETILDISAMRYRELYGFNHPDESDVFHAPAGRGVDIYYFGVPPAWRLPLRAYHAGMFFKNGVPAGYIELLSLCERAETGFNLYYTFREGETAWIYARLLRLFRQVLGVTCFSIDPYQIGLENSEAIASGAFWFYRKLGFRPVNAAVAELTRREEARMRKAPGYRSSPRTLERLAADSLIYEGPGAEPGAWDRFRIRNLGLGFGEPGKTQGLSLVMSRIREWKQWTAAEKSAAAAIVRAKQSGSEARYLRLMQRHPRLRAALLRLGSEHG